MIRDDFKNVKEVTTKEARKKKSMGERNFYASGMSKLKDMNKALGFTVKFTLILMTIAYAMVVVTFIISPKSLVSFIVWSCIYGVLVVFSILWYTVIKPGNDKKIERYKHELERLSAKDLGKISAAYSLYGENYKKAVVEKHREDSAKAREIAKNSAAGNTESSSQSAENDKNIGQSDENN